MRIARVIGLIAAGVVLSACLLILLGAHSYKIPLLSSIGSMVLSVFGPWLAVMPLLVGVFAAWVWRGSHSQSALRIEHFARLASGRGLDLWNLERSAAAHHRL